MKAIAMLAILVVLFQAGLQEKQEFDPLKIDDKTKAKLEEILKRLDDDDPQVRDKAEEELKKHIDDDIKADYLGAAMRKETYQGYELKLRLIKCLDVWRARKAELAEVGMQEKPGVSYNVLYIESNPRFEWQHLTKALTKDKNRKGWGILLSAEPEWPQPKPINETRQIKEIPSKLEGEDGLLMFDVILIGDVDAKKDKLSSVATNDEILENIKKAVIDHGRGVVFVAGDKSNPESFKGTPLEDLLPFKSDPDIKQPEGKEFQSEKKYKVPDDAKSHPIIIENDPINPDRFLSSDQSIQVWEKERPPIFWYKRIIAKKDNLKPSAFVLLTVKSESDQIPLLLTSYCGKGHVVFVSTDETWRWRKLKGDTPYYYPFWKRVLDWASPFKFMFSITTDKGKYVTGDKVSVTAMMLKTKAQEDDVKEVVGSLIPPEGSESKIVLNQHKEEKRMYVGSFTTQAAGYHTIELKDIASGQSSRTFFYVYKK